MLRTALGRSLPSFLLLFCIEMWSGCASHGGASMIPGDLGSSLPPDLASLPDSGVPSDLLAEKSLFWLKQLPSSTNVDLLKQVAIDKSGNVFVACQFSALSDFGDGPRTSKGNHDDALVKLLVLCFFFL